VTTADGRPRVALCIPTLNPGRWASRLTAALAGQTLSPDPVLVIDSSSTDGSLDRFGAIGARIVRIPGEQFDHGGTRNLALDLTEADVLIYMTQDAIPTHETALADLVDGLLEDERTGLAYGRQLPRPEHHARVRAHRAYNYPDAPSRRTAADVAHLGARAAFSSDSFAAYRREAIEDMGRFPSPIIGSEDLWAAARLLQLGWQVAYVPGARVEHSHDYGLFESFCRYFDIGVFHTKEPWREEWLGGSEREGFGLVRQQAAALRAAGVRLATVRISARAGVSWLGFRCGRAHGRLPRAVCRMFSMNPAYWEDRPESGSDAAAPDVT